MAISAFGLAVLVLVCAVGAALGASPALGADKNTPYGSKVLYAPSSDQQAGGRWGERSASAGADFNGDGVNDVFIGTPSLNVGSVLNQGRVYLLSGKAMAQGQTTVLRTFNSPEPQANAQFGFFISVPGDVDGDGKPDIAIGTDAQDVGTHVDQGKAWVFSGATGALLYTLDNPFPQGSATNRARFGSRIGRAGDLNSDGVSDIVVGASANDVPAGCGDVSPLPANCRVDQGQAFIFSGKPSDHAGGASGLIRTLNLPAEDSAVSGGTPCAASCGSFGLAVQSPGDVGTPGSPGSNVAGPLDGVPDTLVDAGDPLSGQGRMYLFDGASGALIRKIDDPEPQAGAIFGFQDAAPLSPGDVGSVGSNGTIGVRDGYADIYGNGFFQDVGGNTAQGKAWVFDGKTGTVLYSLDDPTPEAGGQFGWSMATTVYNNDVFPDLYIGQSPHHVPGASGNGGTYIFGGHKDGLLKGLELPPSCQQASAPGNLGPNLGWTVSAPGDLNGDGEPDYVAGAPFSDVGSNQDQGRLFVFLSNDTSVATC